MCSSCQEEQAAHEIAHTFWYLGRLVSLQDSIERALRNNLANPIGDPEAQRVLLVGQIEQALGEFGPHVDITVESTEAEKDRVNCTVRMVPRTYLGLMICNQTRENLNADT
jgi:hypothetical protein